MMVGVLTYWDCVKLARETEPSINHTGWVIHESETVKYTLDTLDEGKSFRIGRWNPGDNTGKVERTIPAPDEVLFLFDLRHEEEEYGFED